MGFLSLGCLESLGDTAGLEGEVNCLGGEWAKSREVYFEQGSRDRVQNARGWFHLADYDLNVSFDDLCEARERLGQCWRVQEGRRQRSRAANLVLLT